MAIVNIHEAKTQLSKLIDRVIAGEDVTIAKAGKPLVDLVVYRPTKVTFDGWAGEVTIDEETFDDPTPAVVAAPWKP